MGPMDSKTALAPIVLGAAAAEHPTVFFAGWDQTTSANHIVPRYR
jgi:hypothetical protein